MVIHWNNSYVNIKCGRLFQFLVHCFEWDFDCVVVTFDYDYIYSLSNTTCNTIIVYYTFFEYHRNTDAPAPVDNQFVFPDHMSAISTKKRPPSRIHLTNQAHFHPCVEQVHSGVFHGTWGNWRSIRDKNSVSALSRALAFRVS